VADLFFSEVVGWHRHDWVSDDHFSVDGTLIEAWASLKSFQRKAATPPRRQRVDGLQRRETLERYTSTTDPEAKLVRKGLGKEERLCFAGHATMENRNGLCVLFEVAPAIGVRNPRWPWTR
jgi:hypothetical protein